FAELFDRISKNFNTPQLATDLKNTFLAADDKDARPYLLVSLYGSECTSIPDKLMEGLCDALKRHPTLNLQNILPKTEYDVCVTCFEDIVKHSPNLANADLPSSLAENYLTTHEMLVNLKQHKPEALVLFKKWYTHIFHGRTFNPAHEGGKNFIEAYVEAGKNLAERHHFGGIVVIWDEFGFALEDLIGNSHRNAQQEIKLLESFVQTACSPDLGHTIFIGLTHVGIREYANRTGANEVVTHGLGQISGRFKTFKIELNAAESEGYHLLGMQRTWTEKGKQLLAVAADRKQTILDNCRHLSLFAQLGTHLEDVLLDVYPLHPIMAAGLFALSEHAAQSNRTALTFFQDNAPKFLNSKINEAGLFNDELIRLPALVDYFESNLKEKKAADWERFSRAIAQIPTTLPLDEIQSKQAILKLCLLTQLLGEQFQSTDNFLTIALYDKTYSEQITNDLAYLKAADLLWKNDVTEQWTLSGDAGVDVEGLCATELRNFTGQSPRQLFEKYPDMLTDLLPQIGEHDLEPSECGIVRSYRVDLLFPPMTNILKLDNLLLSAQVFLVFAKNTEDAEMIKARIQETPRANVYFWLPLAGIRAESVTIEGKEFKLSELLGRYLALERLQKSSTITPELRRQLVAKWEKNRQQLLTILQILFGRDGLQSGKSQILKAGSADAIDCKSWHDFRHYLGDMVRQTYPNEIPIRAMGMNLLHDEKYIGSKLVNGIVERILYFADNPTYRTDLLGEVESSQAAGVIDGVLGANDLFISCAEGWDIKKVDKTNGKIHTVLKVIHDTLLRKREYAYSVSKLRDELVAPPYGIPACNLAILAAVAIRHEMKRLRWGSTKETDFVKNLTDAFEQDSKLTIKLFEFTTKQLAILEKVGDYFSLMPELVGQTREEFATQCCYRLRDFIKGQSEAVKYSPKLHEKAQKLVKFFDLVGKSQQEMAEFLIELAGAETELLKIIFDDFAKVENEKRFDIEQSWQRFLSEISTYRDDLILRLTHDKASSLAKSVGKLLNGESVSANDLTWNLLGKSFEDCNDGDIGKCQMCLENHVDYHPPRPPQAPILPSPVFIPPLISLLQNTSLIDTLRHQIDSMQLPRNEIRQALEQLLNEYRD
ncbi:MAG: hypothetical protein PHN45_06705, partial [Methylococcales bacterium]|nr:hypothetical protein [Methylococcales bacterium]